MFDRGPDAATKPLPRNHGPTGGATIMIRFASQRRDTIELLRRRGRFYLRDL